MAGHSADGGWLDWCLAALTFLLWSAIYVIFVWRDPELRRGLRRAVATWRLPAAHRPRLAGSAPAPAQGWARAATPGRPVARPHAPSARQTSSALRKPAELPVAAPAAPTLAIWRAAHLPLRYRLLGQVRRASNDN